MIFAHGSLLPESGLPALLDGLEEELNAARASLTLEAETVIDAIDALGRRLDSGALDGLLAQHAPPRTREELARVRPLLRRESLELKLSAEAGQPFRRPRPQPYGRALALPLGVLLHVTPGNMAGLPLFSAVEGLLTGNVNLLKLPREDKGLSMAVLAQLTQVEPKLAPFLYAFDVSSGDTKTLKRLAALADGVVTWGGDGAVAAMRSLAPIGCKLIEWGHRLSFAYIAGYEDRERELAALAQHVIHTGGLLCSSCQVIFLDTDSLEEGEAFCRAFLPVLEGAAAALCKTVGQAAEAALYARQAYLEHVLDGRPGDRLFRGRGCSLTLGEDRELELSPLHGNVRVKRLPRKELLPVLRRQRGRLQTAGLLCAPADREELAGLLARAGVTRITRAGHMSHAWAGGGHDGEYPLRRYLRVVDVER